MRGRLEDQEAALRRALDIFIRLEDHECASRALDTFAECAWRAGRKEEAKRFLQQVAQRSETDCMLESKHPRARVWRSRLEEWAKETDGFSVVGK